MASPVIVCLHGLGRSAADWDGVRVGIESLGQVVTPQLPRDAERAQHIAAATTPEGAILVGHSMGAVIAMRLAAEPGRALRGVVLTSSFFPPARNGRSWDAAVVDYAGHRLAFLRGLSRPDRLPGTARVSTRGLGYLVRTALHGSGLRKTMDAIAAPVLVVHAADDHYVPLDFVLAAVARQPSWGMGVLDDGGHYPHIIRTTKWLDVVRPWLERLRRGLP